jgi:hypothetical protein
MQKFHQTLQIQMLSWQAKQRKCTIKAFAPHHLAGFDKTITVLSCQFWLGAFCKISTQIETEARFDRL